MKLCLSLILPAGWDGGPHLREASPRHRPLMLRILACRSVMPGRVRCGIAPVTAIQRAPDDLAQAQNEIKSNHNNLPRVELNARARRGGDGGSGGSGGVGEPGTVLSKSVSVSKRTDFDSDTDSDSEKRPDVAMLPALSPTAPLTGYTKPLSVCAVSPRRAPPIAQKQPRTGHIICFVYLTAVMIHSLRQCPPR